VWLININQKKARAGLGKPPCNCRSDASSSSRDDHRASVQIIKLGIEGSGSGAPMRT